MRGKAFVVKASKASLILSLTMAFGDCSEPDNRVSRSTADGQFELVLQTERNWVMPDGSLPVRVVVRRLAETLEDGLVGEVAFVVNNGSVSPSRLTATIPGGGTEGDEQETEYSEWVTFKADRDLSAEQQGEINAIFRDALATLKIRIVPDPESL